MRVPNRPFFFFKRKTILWFYPNGHSFFIAKQEILNCTQTAIPFLNAKYEIFKVVSKGSFAFGNKLSCIQIAIRFLTKNNKIEL